MKPCIECGKECEILPVQLGDFFTLTYLRVCSSECMFLVAYGFMREIQEHKRFRNYLYDLQNEEDKNARSKFVDEVTQESLKRMREDFEVNPNLLTTPIPESIAEMFKSSPSIPNVGQTVRFTRPTLENRIKWQIQSIDRLKTQLANEEEDLKKLLEEKG